jgi:proteasome accessory factor B
MPQASWQPTKSDKSERLLHLTCALLVSPYGLTKDEIFSAVKGYRDSLQKGTSRSSVERMFERDKDELRDTGVQIQTFNPPLDSENNQESRYRIPQDSLTWPKPISLNSRQLQLLNLAAQVWAQASLSTDANRAINRLRALGVAAQDSDIIGIAPRLKTHEPSFWKINQAIEASRSIRFDYRKPGQGKVESRHVVPWSLQNIDGQWLLISFDLDRGEQRIFLLKRIVSRVSITEDEYESADPESLKIILDDLANFTQGQVAELEIEPDSEAWFHFDSITASVTEGSDLASNRFKIHYQDLYLLAEDLREYGTDVRVIEPVELAEAIRSGLMKVVADHA